MESPEDDVGSHSVVPTDSGPSTAAPFEAKRGPPEPPVFAANLKPQVDWAENSIPGICSKHFGFVSKQSLPHFPGSVMWCIAI